MRPSQKQLLRRLQNLSFLMTWREGVSLLKLNRHLRRLLESTISNQEDAKVGVPGFMARTYQVRLDAATTSPSAQVATVSTRIVYVLVDY